MGAIEDARKAILAARAAEAAAAAPAPAPVTPPPAAPAAVSPPPPVAVSPPSRPPKAKRVDPATLPPGQVPAQREGYWERRDLGDTDEDALRYLDQRDEFLHRDLITKPQAGAPVPLFVSPFRYGTDSRSKIDAEVRSAEDRYRKAQDAATKRLSIDALSDVREAKELLEKTKEQERLFQKVQQGVAKQIPWVDFAGLNVPKSPPPKPEELTPDGQRLLALQSPETFATPAFRESVDRLRKGSGAGVLPPSPGPDPVKYPEAHAKWLERGRRGSLGDVQQEFSSVPYALDMAVSVPGKIAAATKSGDKPSVSSLLETEAQQKQTVKEAAASADVRSHAQEAIASGGFKYALGLPEEGDIRPADVLRAATTVEPNKVFEDWVRWRESQPLRDGRALSELSEKEAPAERRRIRSETAADVAVLKTVGVFGTASMQSTERDPHSVLDAFKPKIEVLGVDESKSPVTRMQSPWMYALDLDTAPAYLTVATGLPDALARAVFGEKPGAKQIHQKPRPMTETLKAIEDLPEGVKKNIPDVLKDFLKDPPPWLGVDPSTIAERRTFTEVGFDTAAPQTTERIARWVAKKKGKTPQEAEVDAQRLADTPWGEAINMAAMGTASTVGAGLDVLYPDLLMLVTFGLSKGAQVVRKVAPLVGDAAKVAREASKAAKLADYMDAAKVSAQGIQGTGSMPLDVSRFLRKTADDFDKGGRVGLRQTAWDAVQDTARARTRAEAAHAVARPGDVFSPRPLVGNIEDAAKAENAISYMSTPRNPELGFSEGLRRAATLVENGTLPPSRAMAYAERLLDSGAHQARQLATLSKPRPAPARGLELLGDALVRSGGARVSTPSKAREALSKLLLEQGAVKTRFAADPKALAKAEAKIAPKLADAGAAAAEAGIPLAHAEMQAFKDDVVRALQTQMVGDAATTLPEATRLVDDLFQGGLDEHLGIAFGQLRGDVVDSHTLAAVDSLLRSRSVEAAAKMRTTEPMAAAAQAVLLGESASRFRGVRANPTGWNLAKTLGKDAFRVVKALFVGGDEMAPWARQGLSAEARRWTINAARVFESVASDVSKIDTPVQASDYLKGAVTSKTAGLLTSGKDRMSVFLHHVDVTDDDIDLYVGALLQPPIGRPSMVDARGVMGRRDSVKGVLQGARTGAISPEEVVERLHHALKGYATPGSDLTGWNRITAGWIAAHSENVALLNEAFGDGLALTKEQLDEMQALSSGSWLTSWGPDIAPETRLDRAIAVRRMIGPGAMSDVTESGQRVSGAVRAWAPGVHPQRGVASGGEFLARLKASNANTVAEALDLARRTGDAATEAVAEHLMSLGGSAMDGVRLEVGVVFREVGPDGVERVVEDALGAYDPVTRTVRLSDQAHAGTAVHEVVHVFTEYALRHPETLSAEGQKAVRQLRSLFEAVAVDGKLAEHYGISAGKVDEFLAEAFTNPEFARELRGLTAVENADGTFTLARKTPGEPSLWSRFVTYVAGVLGMGDVDALEHVIRSGMVVMDEGKAVGRATDAGSLYARVSPASPRGKKGINIGDPHTEHIPANLKTLSRDTASLAKAVAKLEAVASIRPLPPGATLEARAENVVTQLKENLLWLYGKVKEKMPEVIVSTREWYVGANMLARRWAAEHNITLDQAAAAIACLSPSNDWRPNVSQAERLIRILKPRRAGEGILAPWSPEMSKTLDGILPVPVDEAKSLRIYENRESLLLGIKGKKGDRAAAVRAKVKAADNVAADKKLRDGIRNKRYSDLSEGLEKAAWVRVYDESHNPRPYREPLPGGLFGGFIGAEDGTGVAEVLTWQTGPNMAKAISVLEDGSQGNLHAALGEGHKVRSFFNNILEPESAVDVTVDTHAGAGAAMLPWSSEDTSGIFGGNESVATGIKGSYPLFAEAFFRSADELKEKEGLLPRELQSVLWEGAKGLFSPGYKTAQKASRGPARGPSDVERMWLPYKQGVVDANTVRERIYEAAGGIEYPEWWGRRHGLDAGPQTSSYQEFVPASGLLGGPPEGVGRGAGGEPAAGAAGGVGKGTLYSRAPKPGFRGKEGRPRTVTLFSGGGLVEEGLRGIVDPTFAVENNPDIAGVYRAAHGDHVLVDDVQKADLGAAGDVDYLHASPVCKNFSKAKVVTADGEQPLDIETARATAAAITKTKPKVFTLENVKGYQGSEAMRIVEDALRAEGYTFDARVYDAADYGAPTQRQRLLLRAVKDGPLPPAPAPTTAKTDWYATVADLVEDLPNDVAPPWMRKRLEAAGINPDDVKKPTIVMGGSASRGNVPFAEAGGPAPTIKATPKETHRILLPGGVVKKVTPQAMARITGLSDSYPLPKDRALATTIIGNGVPPALSKAVFGPLLVEDVSRGAPDVLYSRAQTTTPQFKNWFRDSRVVDEEGAPRRLYHGTTHEFEAFDPTRANVQNHHGRGIYLTSEPADVGENYATRTGPDISSRIETLYESLLDIWEDPDAAVDLVEAWAKANPERAAEAARLVKALQSPFEQHQVLQAAQDYAKRSPDSKLVHDVTRWRAEQEIAGTHGGAVLPLYASIQNPVDLRPGQVTRFDIETVWDETGEEVIEETGLGVRVIEALREQAEAYSPHLADEVLSYLDTSDGFTAADLEEAVRRSGEYFLNDVNGEPSSAGQFLQDIYREVGFDGIVINADETFGKPARKYGRKGMSGVLPDTEHWVAFEPTQVKSATGNRGTFDPRDERILYSRARKPLIIDPPPPVVPAVLPERIKGDEAWGDVKGPVGWWMPLDEAEEALGGMGQEHVVVYAGDGRQVARWGPEDTKKDAPGHDPAKVCVVYPSVLDALAANGDGLYTHNHPSGSPPSIEDVLVARRGNVAELRAVADGEGFTWVLKRPAGGWPEPSVLQAAWGRFEAVAQREAKNGMDRAILSAGGDLWEGVNAKGYSDSLWKRLNADAFTKHWPQFAQDTGLVVERVPHRGELGLDAAVRARAGEAAGAGPAPAGADAQAANARAQVGDQLRLLSPDVSYGAARRALTHAEASDRVPEVAEAARRLSRGEITRAEHEAIVARYKPVEVYTEVPRPATLDEIAAAVSSDKVSAVGVAQSLPAGAPVGLRLDIPAYTRHGVWAVTVHEGKASGAGGPAGRLVGFQGAAEIRDAQFSFPDKAAFAIAQGGAKSPLATIGGKWVPSTPEEAFAKAQAALNDPEWVQVGMDPERHGYFYDRATMQPVVAAEEVVQVGPLVLARKPRYGSTGNFLYSRAGIDVEVRQAGFRDVEDARAAVARANRPFATAPDSSPERVAYEEARDAVEAFLRKFLVRNGIPMSPAQVRAKVDEMIAARPSGRAGEEQVLLERARAAKRALGAVAQDAAKTIETASGSPHGFGLVEERVRTLSPATRQRILDLNDEYARVSKQLEEDLASGEVAREGAIDDGYAKQSEIESELEELEFEAMEGPGQTGHNLYAATGGEGEDVIRLQLQAVREGEQNVLRVGNDAGARAVEEETLQYAKDSLRRAVEERYAEEPGLSDVRPTEPLTFEKAREAAEDLEASVAERKERILEGGAKPDESARVQRRLALVRLKRLSPETRKSLGVAVDVEEELARDPILYSKASKLAAKIAPPGGKKPAGNLKALYLRTMDTEIFVPKLVREEMAKAMAKAYTPEVEGGWGSILGRGLLSWWSLTNTRGAITSKPGYLVANLPGDFEQIMLAFGISKSIRTAIRSEGALFAGLLFTGAPGRVVGAAIPGPVGAVVGSGVEFGIGLLASTFIGKNKGWVSKALQGAAGKGEAAGRAFSRVLGLGTFRIEVSKILEGGNDIIRIGNEHWTAKELREIFIRGGVFDGFDRAELAPHIGALGRFFGMPAEGVQHLAETVSLQRRIGLAVTLIEDGMRPEEAAQAVVKALFDYRGSMSEAESSWLRKVLFPFWSWQKNMNRLVLGSLTSPMGAYRLKQIATMERTAQSWGEHRDWFTGEPASDGDDVGVLTNFMSPPELEAYEKFAKYRKAVEKVEGVIAPEQWNALLSNSNTSVPTSLDWARNTAIPKELWLESEDLAKIHPFVGAWYYPEQARSYLHDRAQVRMGHTDPLEGGVGDPSSYWHAVAPKGSVDGALHWFGSIAAALSTLVPGMKGDTMEHVENVVDITRSPLLGAAISAATGKPPPDRVSQSLLRFLFNHGLGDGLTGSRAPGITVNDDKGVLRYEATPAFSILINYPMGISDLNRTLLATEGSKGEAYTPDALRLLLGGYGISPPAVTPRDADWEGIEKAKAVERSLPRFRVERDAEGNPLVE